jgi:phosphatidylglycerol lysyltransferase
MSNHTAPLQSSPKFDDRTLAKFPSSNSSLARTRELVLVHGWNSTCYQIINPGIEHWFAPKKEAVVGFVSCAGVRVVAGAPVCALEDLPEVVAEFELDAAQEHERVCYFCAEARLESFYATSPNHAKILLGAQPVWQPSNWAEKIARHKSLRAQLNRARNKGVTVVEWSTEKASNHPELTECLREWLTAKGLPPLHFLVESDTLARLFDRRIFVAQKDDAEIFGFVVLSPVANRNGWLFEQFVHRPGAPNGSVELMIDAAMRALAKDGYEYATLGLSPLSSRAQVAPFNNPLWVRILLAWMRKHGQRFYNFEGLDAFKSKLQPESWEPVFAIANERRLSPRTLYAIAAAFSGNAPIRLVLAGLLKALTTEIKWFRQRIAQKLDG